MKLQRLILQWIILAFDCPCARPFGLGAERTRRGALGGHLGGFSSATQGSFRPCGGYPICRRAASAPASRRRPAPASTSIIRPFV